MHKSLTLEKRIEAELKSYDGKMSIYADDLKGNVIKIGIDEKFETASTIKTYILACLFDKVKKGEVSLDDMITYKQEHFVDGSGVVRSLDPGLALRAKDVATLMIIVSDNAATNMMIDFLGLEDINACIQKLGCKDTVLHNPINFEKYDKLGTSTVADYASIFIRLLKGELIGPEEDAQMLEIFKKQHYNSTITKQFPVALFDDEDCGAEAGAFWVASKSGSMNACRNDGGIVHTPYGDYVIVMFNKEFSDAMYYPEHPATVFGSKVSKLLFDQYLALEGRFVKEAQDEGK